MEVLTAAVSEDLQRRTAGSLAARGIGAGDRVAFLTQGSGAMLSALLGALRVGVVPVPLNPALLARERELLLVDAEPSLVVDEPTLAELVAGPPTELAPVPLARPMHYTSGTTGRPKGVWSGVLDEAEAVALVARGGRAVGLRARRRAPRVLAAPPLGPDPLRWRARCWPVARS